jgi:predicted protein tyrosine phosphatase
MHAHSKMVLYFDIRFKNLNKEYSCNKFGVIVLGTTPSASILTTYRQTIDKHLQMSPEKLTIAVHCVSGIGRAPVLATVGLLDYTNLDPASAIEYVRSIRRGALNKGQVNWILDKKYKTDKRRSSLAKMFKKVLSF